MCHLRKIIILCNKRCTLFLIAKKTFAHSFEFLFNLFILHKRKYTHTKMERVVKKNGEANTKLINLKGLRRRFFTDSFNAIIDLNWICSLIVFLMSFFISWTLFALIWFCISEFSDENCISNINKESSFLGSFLFSIETQQTIGYGFHFITHGI